MAVRDFAKATHLIARARRRLAQLLPASNGLSEQSPTPQQQVSAAAIGLTKLRDRVEARAANLSAVLQEELTRTGDRHGELRVGFFCMMFVVCLTIYVRLTLRLVKHVPAA